VDQADGAQGGEGPARAEAAREIAQERGRREEARAGLQHELDEHWKLLSENDPHTVLETLEAAFADDEAPAAPINCEEGRATVVLLVEAEDLAPERVPSVTPTGRPTTRKLSQTDRNKFYLSWIFSNILVTVKEAFAVAPGLGAVTTVALSKESNPFGETHFSAIYSGTFHKGTVPTPRLHTRRRSGRTSVCGGGAAGYQGPHGRSAPRPRAPSGPEATRRRGLLRARGASVRD
jgi:hypothetical protein